MQTKEEIKILNRLITHKKIELVIKKMFHKDKPAPDVFTGEYNSSKGLKRNCNCAN